MLTQEQIVILRAAIFAETDPNVVQWRTPATRADNKLSEWLNGKSSTDAWLIAAAAADIEDATDWPAFDGLTAGKRDSWAMFLNRDRDFARAKVRKWVTDVWGNATANSPAEAILKAGVEKAKRGEAALGGTLESTGTVSALDRNYVGDISVDDVSRALNL